MKNTHYAVKPPSCQQALDTFYFTENGWGLGYWTPVINLAKKLLGPD